tara:strand:- start:115 stop:486 length:372 start_codon:yes stop_codon:yes gene_type:complete
MDQLNDFTKIIHNTYENTGITQDSIYDEILKREDDIKEVIDRVITYEKVKESNELFVNTKFSDILVNIFKILNDLLDDLTNINKMTFRRFKNVVRRDKRIIYIGLFMIICAVFLALIEISDSV